MYDVFAVIGVLCAVLLSVGVAAIAVTEYRKVDERSQYAGLRDQIADTVAEINKHYDNGDVVSARAVKFILMQLHSRYWPKIDEIKEEDAIRFDGRQTDKEQHHEF